MHPFKSRPRYMLLYCPPRQRRLSGFHGCFSQPWTAIDAATGLIAEWRVKRFISSAETNATSQRKADYPRGAHHRLKLTSTPTKDVHVIINLLMCSKTSIGLLVEKTKGLPLLFLIFTASPKEVVKAIDPSIPYLIPTPP